MKKNTHGGKRMGAGRKKSKETKIITFRVPADQAEKLKNLIKKLLKRELKK